MNTLQQNRRSALRWLAVAATMLTVGTSSAAAGNQDIELTLFHGTKAAAESIPAGWPELKDPPFNAYNKYEQLSTKTLSLTKGTPTKENLPDGSALEATLIEIQPKVKVELVLKDKKGTQVSKGTYSAAKGKKFLPVSTPYQNGALVIGVKVL